MRGWLLDTNVLSELRRPKPDARVVKFVSRRMKLNDWLDLKLRPMFEERVLEINEDIMLKWRMLVEEGWKSGHTLAQPDLMIAATALHHGLTIVSRDTSEYERANVPVLNPWTATV